MRKLFILLITLCLSVNLSAFALSFGKSETKTADQTDTVTEKAKVLYAQNEIDETLKVLTSKNEDDRSEQDWLLIGNIMQDKEKIDEAVYAYNQSINKNPKFYKAHYNLGYIYLIQNKPNSALSEFKLAAKYKPDFAPAYYNTGCAYLKLKKYSSARYNFFKALDLKANDPNVYYNIAYTYKMLGKEKQAQTYLDLYNKMIEDHQF